MIRLERFKEQFVFLREYHFTILSEVQRFMKQTEAESRTPEQQRMQENADKKKRKALYDALGDAEALAPAKQLYEKGLRIVYNRAEP